MSTHSILARPTTDNGWEGRYCHWNGYPTYQAKVLLEMTRAVGVERLRAYLLDEHTAWSKLGGDMRRKPGWTEPSKAPDPERQPRAYRNWARHNECYCHSVRVDHRADAATIGLTTDTEPFDGEWLYVLADDGLKVYPANGLRVPPVATLPWDATPTEAELLTVECGGDYERCMHVASVHVPELASERSGGLAMVTWLGREPRTFHQVDQVTIKDVTYTIGGGFLERLGGNNYGNRWFGCLTDPNGGRVDLPIARVLGNGKGHEPLPEVTWHYPLIRSEMNPRPASA